MRDSFKGCASHSMASKSKKIKDSDRIWGILTFVNVNNNIIMYIILTTVLESKCTS